jgi:hemolysin D
VKLLSPVSGTILKLEDKFQGTVIKPGDVVATVVPKNQDFHVEVDIDPADITHVYEGAKVKIMLDALPSQKHGELIGRVSLLSKDTVDEDLAGEKRSVYRAEIDILENKLVKLPDNFQLLPSMNVSGNIISGKRTVMTFLLFPVIKTLETSFREP